MATIHNLSPAPVLADALTEIAQPLRQATVQILGQRGETGSGVIWNPTGVIITNAHVVRHDRAQVVTADDRTLVGRVTARDVRRDLVALQVEATDLPEVTIARTDRLRPGELVFAVGHPLGLPWAVTLGVIHTVGPVPNRYQSWIQADIALAPGNSGGPLANALGQVIGINTMIVNGQGFAIPSQAVEQFLQQTGDRPYLGLTLQWVRLGFDRPRSYGWLITAIEPGSPAAAARLLPGDVLLGVGGEGFRSENELATLLAQANPGDSLPLTIRRADQTFTIAVVLWNRDLPAKAA